MSRLKDRIQIYLMSYPETRENNEALMSIIWQYEADKFAIGADNFQVNPLVLLKQNKLTSWDSATRAKRKLQEEHPELRGQTYNLRKAKAKKVKNNLDNLFGNLNKVF